MRTAAGNAIGFLGRISSQSTLIIGIVYLWYHHPHMHLKFSECSFESKPSSSWVDCNQEWQSNFGMSQLPFMTPFLVGLIGTFMYRPMLLQVQGFPKNFLQYGIWLLVQGIFANFGYCGKLGVLNGWYSIFVAILAFIGQLTGLQTDRMLQLKGSKVIDCVADDDDPSRTLDAERIQDYFPWTVISAIFCPIFGGMSMYHSYNVKALKKKKDLHNARLASARAAKWGLWALLFGTVVLGSGLIIGLTNGRVAPQPPADDDDEDQYGYLDEDDGDDDADDDADADADADADTVRRLRFRG